MPDHTKFSDIDLIVRCLERDAEAWEALVRRYQRLIVSITVKFGLPPDETTDVFQSVCLVLLRQLPNLRNHAKLSSWIITTTVRECWKLRRRKAKTYLLSEEEWEVAAGLPDERPQLMEEQLLIIERQHMIRQAIEALPDRCRELIESLFYRNPSATYADISRRLKIPVASVGPIRGRCLAKLKETLKKKGFF